MIRGVVRSPVPGRDHIEPEAYQEQTDLVMQYLAKPGDERPTMDALMTNRFVGSVKISADGLGQQMRAPIRQLLPASDKRHSAAGGGKARLMRARPS